MQHVYLRQQHRGLDVLGAEATVNVKGGKVVHSGSRLLVGLDDKATGSARLGAVQAFAAAAKGLRLAAPVGVRALSPETGVSRATVLTDGGVAARPVSAHLAYQAVEGGTARLAWVLEVELPTADHWYVASVDAEDGTLLTAVDLVVSEQATDTAAALARPARFGRSHTPTAVPLFGPSTQEAQPDATPDGASYRVFQLPLESPNDGPQTLVKDPADPRFSPYGWHDVDGKPGADRTIAEGNNVHAYSDSLNLGGGALGAPTVDYDGDAPDPVIGEVDGGPTLTFDNAFDPDDTTAQLNRKAAITNLFYWNNTIHDVLAGYGFDEAAGNFQTTNYSGEGLGADSVKAQAQDGSGPTDNANFGTPAEGQRPRMQMYLWDPSAPVLVTGDPSTVRTDHLGLRDGDFDSGVITHEYSHGVSNRLTGGPSNVSCLSTSQDPEQMGEGWSDFFGVSLTMRPGDDGAEPRGLGTYVLFDDSRKGPGIRPAPYSTDMGVNPATYESVKDAVAPHGVGYVWASMLYEVYWALVEKHSFNPDVRGDWTTGGNNLATQLVVDGMKMQPCKPGFVDGRDAILAADQALTGGDNQCEIWGAFAKRGLGLLADQGSSASKNDGTEDFTLPSACSAA